MRTANKEKNVVLFIVSVKFVCWCKQAVTLALLAVVYNG
jgi:hypothetical protein